ncbi:MAG: cysteine desulfurase [Bacteroidia bacterium]|nr:cysteine desulfurase [Bacteroidia bacterium]MDW8089701.1 cysteine desulfurase family protein [Bacteroidia bacterium]
MELVYLDYAASTPLDPEVEACMLPYLRAVGNPSAIHAAGRYLRTAIEEARTTIAQLVGADPGQIIFTSGGTEADNHALWGTVETLGATAILYNPTEHHAVLHTIEAIVRRRGLRAYPIAIDRVGRIQLEHLEALLRRYPKSIVAVMHANNEIGTLQPVSDIAALTQKYGGWYLCDTVQTIGLGWVEAPKLGADFFVASAHKFYGPRGVGFLYRRLPVGRFIHGGAQEREQRAGTENVAGIVGLALALRKAYQRRAAYVHELRTLKHYLMQRLQEVFPDVVFHGDVSEEGSHPGILNFRIPSHPLADLLVIHLDIEGVCVSGTSACASGSSHPSHVLQALGLSAQAARSALRFSWGLGTQKAHLDRAIEVLQAAATLLPA